ncbi:MAG: gluconokinase [Pyrinomonadaceae bacterium]
MQQPLVLALDIGSSSIRASVYDGAGNPIDSLSAKHDRQFHFDADGTAELDADDAVEQVARTVDELLGKTDQLGMEIEYVAVCSMWHTLVGIDERGRPTTKVFSWADSRSRKYADELKNGFNQDHVRSRTGSPFHSSYWPAKLLWLKSEFKSAYNATTQWLSFSDYLGLILFDETATSLSMASGTGLFDIRRCRWDEELASFLGVDTARLPAVTSEPRELNQKNAKRWPSLRRSKWFVSIGDGAADNVGAGCVTKNKAALMLGTSGALRVAYSGQPPKEIPKGLWCYRVDEQRVIVGGALSDGGGLYDWLRTNLILPHDAEKLIGQSGPGANGLTFLPFLAGERSTGYHGSASGAILGLTSATRPADIVRSALESIAFRFADILERISTVTQIEEIVASGGALRDSPVWAQLIADVLGRDLMMNGAAESSSRGAVLLALESLGKIENIERTSQSHTRPVTTNKAHFGLYEAARKRHQDAYRLLIDKPDF